MTTAPDVPRRIAVVGASGFIGATLVARLRAHGHAVVTVGRSGNADVRWDPARGLIDASGLEGVDAVINLAGERIDQRWTSAARRRILDSRVLPTRLLAGTLARLPAPPAVLVNMSATGIYGDRGDEVLDERSAPGSGFLAEVVQAWEAAAQPARDAGLRVVHPRTGVVLHPSSGALHRLLPIFQLGVGARIGNGRQWMSWIGLTDAVRGLGWLALQGRLDGAVNLTSPVPVRNAEFTRILARVLRRPALAVAPALALRLVYGRMGEETVIGGQRVLPARLLGAGFRFECPELEAALRHELGRA
jgi:uncharacterized protein (TIGR01777 family)